MQVNLISNYGRQFEATGSLKALGEQPVRPSLLQGFLNFIAPALKVSYEQYKSMSILQFSGRISYGGGMFPTPRDGVNGTLFEGGATAQSRPEDTGEFSANGYFVILSETSILGYSPSAHNDSPGGDPTLTADASFTSTSTSQIVIFYPTSFAGPWTPLVESGTSVRQGPALTWLVTG